MFPVGTTSAYWCHKNQQEELSLPGHWHSISSPPSRSSFNSTPDLDSLLPVVWLLLLVLYSDPLLPSPCVWLTLGISFYEMKALQGEKKWILKCTSPITSLIHFYDSVLFNDLLNNLPPWNTSTHFPGAAKVLPKGFKCRLAWTVDVSILALGMLGRNEDTHPRAAESGGLGNTREEF